MYSETLTVGVGVFCFLQNPTRGIVMFSRVGFSDNGDQAMVSMGVRCGDLCGAGGLYLLVKEEGVWKFERATMEWIS